MKRLIAALLFAGAAPSLAFAQAEPQTAAPRDTDAVTLTGMLLPDGQVRSLVSAGFRQGAANSLAGNPKEKALYDAHPGMEAFVLDRVSDTLVQLALADLPALHAQLATVVREEMEPQEIADTLAFFQSPTGTRMRARIAEALQRETPTTAEAGQKLAAEAATAGLTPEDYPTLQAFGTSSAARKMQGLNPKILAASQAWGVQLGAINAGKLKAAREAAEAEYLAKEKQK